MIRGHGEPVRRWRALSVVLDGSGYLVRHIHLGHRPLQVTFMRLSFLAAFALSLLSTQGQVPLQHLWWTDGDILAAHADTASGTLYIGGQFDHVGPRQPYGGEVDAATGRSLAAAAAPDAPVRAAIPDGEGGWYIGGEFRNIGGVPRDRVARILPDGSLHPLSLALSPVGRVNALAVKGDTLFIAGTFMSIGSSYRTRVAAVNRHTGLVYSTNPAPNGEVFAIAVRGSKLYMVGSFTEVGTLSSNYTAVWQLATNNATGGLPTTNGKVHSLAFTSDAIYIAGEFSTVANTPRRGVAKITASGSMLTDWAPVPNSTCTKVVVHQDRLFVSGAFTSIGGQFRAGLAELDQQTALATSWAAACNGEVVEMASSTTGLLIAGAFTEVNGQPRNRVAALGPEGGVLPWDPNADAPVLCIAPGETGHYLGGSFFSVAGVTRRNAAAIDMVTGKALAWDPAPDGPVHAMAGNGDALLIGGKFEQVGGMSRKNLASVLSDGTVTTWDPAPNDTVQMLFVGAEHVYAGGDFTSVGASTRGRVARFDRTTGALDVWASALNGTVLTMAPAGQDVYIGGRFTTVNGAARSRIAAVSAQTGATTAWDPSTSGVVRTLLVTDDLVYIGGQFHYVLGTTGGQSRNYLAALNRVGGSATAWAPITTGPVNGMLLRGDSLIVCGRFGSLSGQLSSGAGSLHVQTGAALGMVCAFQDPPEVKGMVAAGGMLYFHGLYTEYDMRPERHLSVITANHMASGTLSGPICAAEDLVLPFTLGGTFGASNQFTVELSGPNGSFAQPETIATFSDVGTNGITVPAMPTLAAGTYRYRVRSTAPAQIGTSSAPFQVLAATQWFADEDGDGHGDPAMASYACTPLPGHVLVPTDCDDGDAMIFPSAPCDDGLVSTSDDQWTSTCVCAGDSMPVPIADWVVTNGVVRAMVHDTLTDRVFIGGEFTRIGRPIPFGQVLGMENAVVSPGAGDPNGPVRCVVPDGNGGWIIGGEFTRIGQTPRRHLAWIQADGSLGPWDPWVDGPVLAMVRDGNRLFIGGEFTRVEGMARRNLAGLTMDAGQVLPWDPSPDGMVKALHMVNSRLFVGGAFLNIGGTARQALASFELGTLSMEPFAAVFSSNQDRINSISSEVGRLFVAGKFFGVNGTDRKYLAGFELSTGALAPLNFNVIGEVFVVHVTGGGKIYLGGDFTHVSSTVRGGIARANTADASLDAWYPALSAAGSVNNISISGSQVVLGGSFTSVSSIARRNIAKVDVQNSSTVMNWTPELNGSVYCTAIAGPSIYVGGRYTLIGGSSRVNLAAIDARSGSLLPWSTSINGGGVYSLALHEQRLYVGGTFTQFGGVARPRLAATHTITGAAVNWAPAPNGAVHTMEKSGNRLFVGGNFNSIANNARAGLAAFNAGDGVLQNWNANLGGFGYVHTLAAAPPRLYVGGQFSSVNGTTRNGIAAVNLVNGGTQSWAPMPAGEADVRALAVRDTLVSFGGEFTFAAPARSRFAAVDPQTASMRPLTLDPDNTVHALLYDGDRLLTGGRYNNITGRPGVRLSSIDLADGRPADWSPAPNGAVLALLKVGRLLFVGGEFTQVNGGPGNGLAIFTASDCEGVHGGPMHPGRPCDDGDPLTYDDRWSTACECLGLLSTYVQDDVAPRGIGLWPNPSSSMVHFTGPISGTVFDAQGREVTRLSKAHELDLQGLAPGPYTIRMVEGVVLRFVKVAGE